MLEFLNKYAGRIVLGLTVLNHIAAAAVVILGDLSLVQAGAVATEMVTTTGAAIQWLKGLTNYENNPTIKK